VPIVLQSGSLNLLEPSGSVQACNGIALPLLYITFQCSYILIVHLLLASEYVRKVRAFVTNLFMSDRNSRFRKHIKCLIFRLHAIYICIVVADFLRVNAKQMSGIEVGDVLPLLNKAPGRQDVWECGGIFPPIFWCVSQNCEKIILTSSCLSVRPSARNNPAPTGRVFMKFDVCGFFENLSRKFKFY
jgi:hypothetical protein